MSCNNQWQSAAVRQYGLSLVEIMIAITISIVLLAGVGKIFISGKHTYKVQDALSRIQESGRFASDFMSKDIRMAGYSGCNTKIAPANLVDLNGNGTADPFTDISVQAVTGYEYGDLPAALSNTVNLTAAQVKENTDVIVITNAASSSAEPLSVKMLSNSGDILLPASAAGIFQADDVLLVSDCTKADVFAAFSVSNGANVTITHTSAVNTDNAFTSPTPYDTDATVMKMYRVAYYIGTNVNGNPALFRQRLGNGSAMVTEELAEGIEDMQILYGEDLDADGIANRFVDANTAGLNMANVVSVRIGLLAETVEDNIATTPQDYTFMNQTTTPDDKRLRRAFYSVTKLRNRGIL